MVGWASSANLPRHSRTTAASSFLAPPRVTLIPKPQSPWRQDPACAADLGSGSDPRLTEEPPSPEMVASAFITSLQEECKQIQEGHSKSTILRGILVENFCTGEVSAPDVLPPSQHASQVPEGHGQQAPLRDQRMRAIHNKMPPAFEGARQQDFPIRSTSSQKNALAAARGGHNAGTAASTELPSKFCQKH